MVLLVCPQLEGVLLPCCGEVWAETSQHNREIPITKITGKGEVINQHASGLPIYTKQLFEEYLDVKHLPVRPVERYGCIVSEFYFKSFRKLLKLSLATSWYSTWKVYWLLRRYSTSTQCLLP
jgi:hypothetical protein